MNKKAKLYLVILINLLAWGYVGYKVYGALQGDEDIELTNDRVSIKKMDEVVKEEKPFLALNYPDPFLKNGNFSNTHAVHSNSGLGNTTVKPKAPAVAAKTPTLSAVAQPTIIIKYMGLLKNNDQGTHTAMLNVNERSVFVKQNDIIEGYTITEISKDFIRIKKGKEIVTVTK